MQYLTSKTLYKIQESLDKKIPVYLRYINYNSRYRNSIIRVVDIKTKIYKYASDREYTVTSIAYSRNRKVWADASNFRVTTETSQNIIDRQNSTSIFKKVPKDFLGSEFATGDVVFYGNSSYGGILGVVSKITSRGAITLNVAKSFDPRWPNIHSGKTFTVPFSRVQRVIIIDDPHMMLLKA